jgi:hypothetical protein
VNIFNNYNHKFKSTNAGFYCILAIIFTGVFFYNQTVFAQIGVGGAIVAIDEVKEGSGSVKNSPSPKFQNKIPNLKSKNKTQKEISVKNQKNSARLKTAPTVAIEKPVAPRTRENQSNKNYDGFVIGDKYSFLNFEVVQKVQPIYTIKAKEAGASGLVQVEILVGENGKVLTAKARTGNSLLHTEAEKAALATVLNKPSVYGKPARALGFLVYRFGNADKD